MAFSEIVKKIKPAVVGLGMLADERDPLSVVIMGTGFVVHRDGWIMTNRHVAELFMAKRGDVVGIRNARARAVLFVDSTGRNIAKTGSVAKAGVGVVPFPIIEIAMAPEPQDDDLHYETVPDLAVCRISIEKLDTLGLKELPVLPLGDSSKVREGDEVGICGFPLGLTITSDGRLRQMTAIVQRGIVAAVLPWTGIPNPHAFQLDISVNPGSSGSPMFTADTGELVGIVFAAPMNTGHVALPVGGGQENIATIALPTGFGYAIPSNRYQNKPKPVTKLPDVYHSK